MVCLSVSRTRFSISSNQEIKGPNGSNGIAGAEPSRDKSGFLSHIDKISHRRVQLSKLRSPFVVRYRKEGDYITVAGWHFNPPTAGYSLLLANELVVFGLN